MKKKMYTAALAALALTVVGCSSTAPAEQNPAASSAPAEALSFDDLVAAAQEEGSLRVYSSLPEGDQQKMVDGFTEQYGITVESLRLGGNTLPTRFDAETSAGSPSADTVITTSLDFVLTATENDHLVPFADTGVEPLLEGLPDAAILTDYEDAPIVQVISTGFLFHTDMVSASDIPTTWKAFADSDLAERACAVAPDSSEALMLFMAALRDAEGDEVLSTLGGKIARWYPSVIPMNEAVASGECAIGLNSAEFFAHAMKGQGAPVDFAEAPTAVPPIVTGAVATAAESPNAARLFLHYALSEEGGSAIQNPDVGAFGAYDTDKMPANVQILTPEQQRAAFADSKEILALLGF